eukprot:792611_1
MSDHCDQSTTTNANASAEPMLCKMGCGFFGNSMTGDCCSKCFLEAQKKQNDTPPSSQRQSQSQPQPMAMDVEPTPLQQDEPVAPEVPAPVTTAAAVKPEEKKRKKKKKTSYKSMMANMTKRTKDEADIEKE